MILDGVHFQFGDYNSREHNLIFAHSDTRSYDSIMGTTTSTALFNKKDKSRYLITDNFENSPLSFEAEIITDDARPLTQQSRRMVEKALFNKPNYMKLYVDMDDDFMSDTIEYIDGCLKRLFFKCRFVNPIKIENGNGLPVGYKFTVECDSCMAWQDDIEQEFETKSGDIIEVQTDTDIGGYTYPDVTIKIGDNGGDVTLINKSDDTSRLTKFNGVPSNTTIIMKGCINYISGQNYERFENQNFIRLLDGENQIAVTGDISSIKFKWNNRRFI